MRYKLHSYRNALTILKNEDEFKGSWEQIEQVLDTLTDERIINCFNENYASSNKSLSTSLNQLIKDDFSNLGWSTQSAIFLDPEYQSNRTNYWRLDMSKNNISLEVAFDHASVIAWSLLKPVLASEPNHVQKAIQTKLGVIICATEKLKKTGNFDAAIGTYERFISHLRPLRNQLSVPLLIIGLESPKTFVVSQKLVSGKNRGDITMVDDLDHLTFQKQEL